MLLILPVIGLMAIYFAAGWGFDIAVVGEVTGHHRGAMFAGASSVEAAGVQFVLRNALYLLQAPLLGALEKGVYPYAQRAWLGGRALALAAEVPRRGLPAGPVPRVRLLPRARRARRHSGPAATSRGACCCRSSCCRRCAREFVLQIAVWELLYAGRRRRMRPARALRRVPRVCRRGRRARWARSPLLLALGSA